MAERRTLSRAALPWLLPAAAPQGLDWKYHVWIVAREKTRRDFPPHTLFHLRLPGKPPASPPRTVAKGLQHPSQPRWGMSAIPAVGDGNPGTAGEAI